MGSPDPITLNRLFVARLCHDLGGVTGTLAGTLDMVGGGGDPAMLDLTKETAQVLRQRLGLYAAAWGGGAGEMDAPGMLALLQGSPAVPRVTFALDALSPGAALPAPLVPLLALNAALLGAEALPRSGTVRRAGMLRPG